jgi:hypothetical protein
MVAISSALASLVVRQRSVLLDPVLFSALTSLIQIWQVLLKPMLFGMARTAAAGLLCSRLIRCTKASANLKIGCQSTVMTDFAKYGASPLQAQRMCADRPMFQMAMSALGWERPLDAICVNGSFAQIVYFAKSHERPKIAARVGPARCDAASPKQTLVRCCSIIEVVRSNTQDLVRLRSCRAKVRCQPEANMRLR